VAVLSLAAVAVVFARRSKRSQEEADVAKSFHQAPGMFNRWTSRWNQNVQASSSQSPADNQGSSYQYQYPGQAIGATFNRWTARLSQYRPGFSAQTPYNQGSTQVAADYYAPNPVMTQEYNASAGMMSANNPQFYSPSNGGPPTPNV
jgi:hypothetical protein